MSPKNCPSEMIFFAGMRLIHGIFPNQKELAKSDRWPPTSEKRVLPPKTCHGMPPKTCHGMLLQLFILCVFSKMWFSGNRKVVAEELSVRDDLFCGNSFLTRFQSKSKGISKIGCTVVRKSKNGPPPPARVGAWGPILSKRPFGNPPDIGRELLARDNPMQQLHSFHRHLFSSQIGMRCG